MREYAVGSVNSPRASREYSASVSASPSPPGFGDLAMSSYMPGVEPMPRSATPMSQFVCPRCGASNRGPGGPDARQAKCGKCHELVLTGAPLEVSGAQLD